MGISLSSDNILDPSWYLYIHVLSTIHVAPGDLGAWELFNEATPRQTLILYPSFTETLMVIYLPQQQRLPLLVEGDLRSSSVG